eukprot:scaffold35698_cov63-Attheya_sp.AAC.12
MSCMCPLRKGGYKTTSSDELWNNSNTNRNHRCGFRRSNTVTAMRQPKFEGKCKELKGHIYDCTDLRQSDINIVQSAMT